MSRGQSRQTSGPEAVSVLQGDAFALLGGVADASVDLVLTSPPYWGLRTYGHEHNPKLLEAWRRKCAREGTEPVTPPTWEWYQKHNGVLGLEPYPEWYVAHLAHFFGEVRRVIKPRGSLWLNLGDTYFARWSSLREDGRQGLVNTERARRKTPAGGWRQDKQLMMIPARVAIAMQEEGWILRNDVIWRKSQAAPRPETDRLRNVHEHFFHFVKRPPQGRASYHYDLAMVEAGAVDVVDHPLGRSRDKHSATFPESLIRARILSSCPPGGLVLDPFCGTGRTLEVALSEGRRSIGFELSKAFAAAAARNVKEAVRVKAISGEGMKQMANGRQGLTPGVKQSTPTKLV